MPEALIADNQLKISYKSYSPLGKQLQFHTSDAKFRLYIGAWRAGKTYAGCMEAYKQSSIFPNNVGIIFRKDFTDLRDTTMKTFLDIVPPEDILSFNRSEHRLILRNGSEVYFRHLKDGIKLGSLSLGWAFIDEAEEIQDEIFQYLKGRLSLKNASCKMWLVSNPPNTDHWLYKTFVENRQEGYEVFYASTYENKLNLPQDYINSLEKLPESWKKKYLYGQFGFTPDGTPFYSGFKENIHTKDLSTYKPIKIYRGWDYGWHHPACVLTTLDSKGRFLILKEILGSETTIEKFGEYVKTKCKDWYPSIREWIDYGDPAGLQKTDKAEKTSVEILSSLGIDVGSRVSTYRERKEIIERKLSTLIDGEVSLLVDQTCKVIVDSFLGGYHYPTKKQGGVFHPKAMELPFKDGFYEHLMNSLEYVIVNLFNGVETTDEGSVAHYRIVGDLKDVHIEYGDYDDNKYSRAYEDMIIRK